jgi:hypothetical protein
VGYRSIPNLYACPQFVGCEPEVWVTEKIEGTSAHVSVRDGQIHFSHGESREQFLSIFDEALLFQKAYYDPLPLGMTPEKLTIYGEHYGGKVQGMRHLYGDRHRFVAFEVKAGDRWLGLLEAHQVALHFGLDFVDYQKGPFTVEWLDKMRDRPSPQALKCGMPPQVGEGIVIRLDHLKDRDGNPTRIKHKSAAHSETKSQKKIDPSQIERRLKAQEAAEEYVTENRLKHVVQAVKIQLGRETLEPKDTPVVIREMLADIKKEALPGEIDFDQDTYRAVGTLTAQTFKKSLSVVAP